ncbi:TetR/AcrR family transcriptional regulator [Paenibacillus sp. GCM10023248]|uniref:TetR/AcrR family transcriptional regulator n=1 Tax=Bacillales TaxID=1385 RepID=UPI002379A3DC|nr:MULTISPECIES: TetR family transcriptional regulator C-terminal domain-containing protein [Bacillales]MDD9265559.1 TetR family transcriptional regulator C-terminal domain-containing protein [Paenibacillus sp. MAHUQ-63]MDR6878794.1 AcrR family transcriptional regulator [Bacillus sp. 3255]
MNKKQQQAEQTKKKIADAARALFAQKGYKATAIEDIVKAAGCSAGNIYYHFKNKEGLFVYLLEDWNREWDRTWLVKEKQYLTTTDKLYGMAEYLALDQMSHPLTKAADEFFNNAEKAPEVEERINEMVQGYIEFNRRLLQQGIDNDEFAIKNVSSLAIILDSLLLGLSQHSRRMEREEALEAYRLAMDVFLQGIARRIR